MSISYHLKGCFVSLILLTACESDEKKYERLNQDLLIAQLQVRLMERAAEKGEPQCPDLTHLPTNQYSRECSAKASQYRAEMALAQREMNRFMGR